MSALSSIFALLLFSAPLFAQGDELTPLEGRRLQTLSPLPALPASPSNRYADNEEAALFGQKLFFDTRLSMKGKQSCSTCHQAALGWGDGKALAAGLGELNRNSPSLLHAGHQRWFFWDGRADSLWAQVQYPLENPLEMGFTRSGLVRLLAKDLELQTNYVSLFGPLPDGANDPTHFPDRARPPLPSPPPVFAVAPTPEQLSAKDPVFAAWFSMTPDDQQAANQVLANCAKAIAAFERKLVTGPSPFDQYVAAAAKNDEEGMKILGEAERRGMKLFMDKGSCINCHFSPMLSGGEFHNIGLHVMPGQTFDSGRPDGIRTVRVDPMNGRGEFSDARDWQQNVKIRYLAYNKHTYGAYKTPTLRNIALTGPYMHDGRFATLREVLEFYSKLPGLPPTGHREETLLPSDFTDGEMADLEAFLRSLTGTPVDAKLSRAPDSQAIK